MDQASLLQQARVHHEAGRFHDAEKIYRAILKDNPKHAEAWHLLGMIAHEARHAHEAIDFIRRALALDKGRPAYLNNLGIVYKGIDELDEARAQFQAALALDPNYAPALNNLADVFKDRGEIRDAIECYRRALAARPDSAVMFSNLLYTLQFDPDLSRAELAAEHNRFGERFGSPGGQRRRHVNAPDPERPLRIGYVSSCFGKYPPMAFFLKILEHHDRKRHQIYLYSNLLRHDPVTRQVQALADRWHSVSGQSAEQAARQIENDRIDILVDITGHMARNRLDIFALKPAPVQVTQLDYPHSSGLPSMDYRLTDAVVEPADWPTLCPERLWRLPGCLVCFHPPESAPEITPLPAARKGYLTFAAPHQIFKLNDRVLAAYAGVLHALPTARLSLIRSTLTQPQIDLLRERLARVKMPLDRVEFIRPGTNEDYLKCAADVDVMLDAWPYSGQTTTCEYLWMGIPVITLLGDRPAGRVGASILEQLGLADLIASTPAGMAEIACKLAADLPRLGMLRAGLRELMRSTLADGVTFTRGLETAYREMWVRWCEAQTMTSEPMSPRASDAMTTTAPETPPAAPVSLNDRAVALGRVGRYAEAEALLRRDIETRPDQANAYGNLAHLLSLRGALDEAESAFMRAICLDPTAAGWHRRLGMLLRQRGRLAEAAVSLRHADRLQPDDAETLKALGLVQKALGQPKRAIASLRRAVTLAGTDLDLLNDLAVNLNQLGAVAESHACFERILDIDPNYGPALANRAFFLADEGRTEEARELYARGVKKNPSVPMKLALGTLLPVIYQSLDHMHDSRGRLEESMRRLEADGVRLDPTRQVMPTLFYLAYHGLNDRDHAAALARLTAAPRAYQEARPPRKNRDRLRIGILSRHLHNHTIGLLNHGLIAHLDRRQFEVIVLLVGETGDMMERNIAQSAERVVILPGDVAPALKTASALELDILYYPDLGMDPFTWTLAYSRLAPVQCVTWGHPVTTGMPSMDYFISSKDLESAGSDDQYTEKLVRLSRLAVVYKRPATPDDRGDRAALGLSPDAHVYNCPQSLFKFHPDFDAILAEILRQDRAGVVAILAGRSRQWTELLQERLRRSVPDVFERFVFVPRQSRPGFLNLMACSDVVLDPIHFGGGNTTYEALALGLPVVTLPSQFLRCRISRAMYEQMGMRDLIARDADDYARLAVRLGTDLEWRAEIKRQIQEKCGVLFNDVAIVRELEQFFLSVAARN